jgi:hypothetical protein
MHKHWRTTGLLGLLAAAVLAWQWRDSARDAAPAADADTQISAKAPSPSASPTELTAAEQQAAASSEEAAQPSSPSAQRREPAVALDAPPLGFRASEAQRQDDLARMVAAEDLAPLLEEFKRRAAQGDADAAARMRDIYDECMGVHMAQMESTRDPNANQPAFSLELLSADAPLRQAALQIGSSRCGGIIPPGDNRARTIQLGRLHRDSVRLAADLGHPGARVRAQGYEIDPTLRPQRQRHAALLLLQEGSPEALMDLSAYASDSTPFRSDSWILAACELGYPCASVPGIRYNYCATYGSFCEVESLQEFTRQSVSARDWRLFQAERDQILALVQAGDLGALLLSDEAIGGGG